MRKKKLIFIALILALFFIPLVVIAESGTLGTMGTINTTMLAITGVYGSGSHNISGLYFKTIEDFNGLYSIVCLDDTNKYITASQVSDSVDVDLYAGNTIIGSGLFGYNFNSVTSSYQVYFIVHDFTPAGLTGNYIINFTSISGTSKWNLSGLKSRLGVYVPSSAAVFNVLEGYPPISNYIINVRSTFYNTYTFVEVENPLSEVFVTKTYNLIPYSSSVYIYSGNTLLVSESGYTTNDYNGIFYQLPIRIAIKDKFLRWWNTSSMNLGMLSYNISVSPDSINSGESTLITLSSGGLFDSISYIFLYDNYSDINGMNADKTIGKYKHISASTYQKYNDITHIFEASSENPTSYTYINIPTGNHTISAHLVFVGGESSIDISTLLIVSASGLPTITKPVIISINGFNSLSNAYLTDYTLNVKNLNTEIWENFTSVHLTKELTLYAGTDLYGEVNKSGYYLGKSYYTVPNFPDYSFGTYWSIFCIPTSAPIGNYTLIVQVQDYLYKPLPNSLVQLSDGQFKNTGINADAVTFTLAQSTNYTITVSHTGYGTQTEIFNTGTSTGGPKTFRLGLPVTPTKTPSIAITTKPTPYYTLGGVIINGTFCPAGTNPIEAFDFMLCTQLGISDKSTQGLVKALMIIIALVSLFCYLGRNTDNLGILALLGASIGFITSLVLGFIPLWVLLAMLGLGFLVVIILGRQ